MENKKSIGYNRGNVSPDVARVLDTLLANLPADTLTITKLDPSATTMDVIAKLNELIDKVNTNTNSNKFTNLTKF